MQKAFSLLFGAATATLITTLPAPSFSQTTQLPIISGTISITGTNTNIGCTFGCAFQPQSLSGATVLTSLGIVNISAFNGSVSSPKPDDAQVLAGTVSSSNITLAQNSYQYLLSDQLFTGQGLIQSLVFTGNTDGTAQFVPNGVFTNAPTTISASFKVGALPNIGSVITVNIPITSGNITLPSLPPVIPPSPPVIPPTSPVVPPSSSVDVVTPIACTDCLIISPNLRIANSTFLSPDLQEPEYRQEYRNDFSTSSFEGGRILGLENK